MTAVGVVPRSLSRSFFAIRLAKSIAFFCDHYRRIVTPPGRSKLKKSVAFYPSSKVCFVVVDEKLKGVARAPGQQQISRQSTHISQQ